MTDVWGLVDYGPLSERLAPAAAAAVAAVAVHPGEDALDVAAGDGTAAVALARAGARTVAVDASPAMVAAGGRRCAGADVTWLLGDAADLPVPDACVDAAVSSLGVMFADPVPALAELGRVLRPGGRLALTVWSVDGFMGRMGRRIAEHTGGPAGDLGAWARADGPAGIGAWCRAAGLAVPVVVPSALPWWFADGPTMTAFLRAHSPVHASLASSPGADALFADIERLAAPKGGAVEVDAGYVLVTTTKGDPR